MQIKSEEAKTKPIDAVKLTNKWQDETKQSTDTFIKKEFTRKLKKIEMESWDIDVQLDHLRVQLQELSATRNRSY